MATDPYAGLHPELAARVKALIAASGGRITIRSGHRTVERQAQLVEAAKRKHGKGWRKWVAPAGKSNHNKGEAVDLGGDLDLAHQLAERFNLRAPMSWEKWHFERAEHKSSKTAQTRPPSQPGTTTQPAPIALAPPTPATPAAPVPEAEDRKRLDVQFATLLDFLREPEVV